MVMLLLEATMVSASQVLWKPPIMGGEIREVMAGDLRPQQCSISPPNKTRKIMAEKIAPDLAETDIINCEEFFDRSRQASKGKALTEDEYHPLHGFPAACELAGALSP